MFMEETFSHGNYSCVFGNATIKNLLESLFLHDNSKRNQSRNTKLKYTVEYENSLDDFNIELRRIKVKVTVGVQYL